MKIEIIDIEKEGQLLPEWLKITASGAEVILTLGSKPIARVLPIRSTYLPRIPGLHLNTAWISPDFDEPLGREYWSDI